MFIISQVCFQKDMEYLRQSTEKNLYDVILQYRKRLVNIWNFLTNYNIEKYIFYQGNETILSVPIEQCTPV